MSWYNIHHNSSYYFIMLYVTEITKFPCQLHYNKIFNHTILSILSFIDSYCFTLMLLQKCFMFKKIYRKNFLTYIPF